MFHPSDPIGILDSGIGGFSVVRQVQRTLPGEELVYFGDGAHIPYGNHPEDKIVAMARYMFRFMEDHHVKALLVACNTISCVIGQCEGEVSCPTFNAVQAGAEAAARLSVDKIGVISTVFTHNSRCYPEGILARSPRSWWSSAVAVLIWPGWWSTTLGTLPAWRRWRRTCAWRWTA